MFLRARTRTGPGPRRRRSLHPRLESLEIRLTLSATQLVVTSPPPASVVAGQTFGLSVSAEDASGNVDPTFNSDVTVSGVSTSNGTSTVAAVNGVASFSGLTLDTAGAEILFIGTVGSSLSATATSPIAVTATSATHLIVISPPPGTVTAGSKFGLVLAAGDPYGNVVPSFPGSVTIALANNPGGGTLAGTANVTLSNGLATFSDLSIDAAGAGYTLQATSSGLAPVSWGSLSFSVTAAAASQIVVTAPPPPTVAAGQVFAMSATVEDQFGNPVAGFPSNLAVSPTNGETEGNLGGTLTAPVNAGVATFPDLTLVKAGAGLTLAVSGTGLTTATTSPFTVMAGQATQLVVISSPPTVVSAGVGFGLQIAAEDPYGNVDSAFAGSVTVALASDPAQDTLVGATTLPFSAGLATFSGLTLIKAGSGDELQATSSGLTPAAPASLAFSVEGGPPSQLVLTSPPPATVTAGVGFGLVLAAEDLYGNVDSAFSGSVTVALASNPGGSTLGGATSVSFINGLAIFTDLTMNQAGSGYTFVAVGNGLTPSSSLDALTLSVTPAPAATRLVIISPLPADLTAGQSFGLSVAAESASGSVDTAFTGSVVVALASNSAGGILGGTTTANLVNGVASFYGLTLDQAGSGYTLQAASGGLAPSSTPSFGVTPAAATQLVVISSPPPVIAVGQPFGLTVAVEDQFGNPVTGFDGNLAIAPTSIATEGALGGTLTVPVSAGVASFAGLTLVTPGTAFTLQVSGTGLPTATTSPFTVASVQPTQLVVVASPPSSVTAGVGFGLQIAAEDPFGNVTPSFSGVVAISLSSNPGGATLGGTIAVAAVDGVATFAGLTLNTAGAGETLLATSAGLAPTTTSSITVLTSATTSTGSGSTGTTSSGTTSTGTGSSGGTTSTGTGSSGTSSSVTGSTGASPYLVISSQPTRVDAGPYFQLTVVVEEAGSTDTAFNGKITLALAANPGGAILGGNLTMPVYNGQVTFYGLTLNVAASGYTIRATGSGLTSALSSPISVVNPATHLTVQAPTPSGVASNAAFGVTVAAENAGGGLASDYNGNVTIALSGNRGKTKLHGVRTVRAIDGVATFSGLTLSGARKGTSLQLRVSADGLAAAMTNLSIAGAAAIPRRARIIRPAS
jgi:hypothetical protein